MKECDIFGGGGGQNILWPVLHIFRGQDPQPSSIYVPDWLYPFRGCIIATFIYKDVVKQCGTKIQLCCQWHCCHVFLFRNIYIAGLDLGLEDLASAFWFWPRPQNFGLGVLASFNITGNIRRQTHGYYESVQSVIGNH